MSEGRLPKPNMRNLHSLAARKHILQLAISALSTGLLYKFLVTDVASNKIEEFYKTYDPEAALKVMDEAGLMQSTS